MELHQFFVAQSSVTEPVTKENYSTLMERIDTYLSEFDAHGTDHISIDLDE